MIVGNEERPSRRPLHFSQYLLGVLAYAMKTAFAVAFFSWLQAWVLLSSAQFNPTRSEASELVVIIVAFVAMIAFVFSFLAFALSIGFKRVFPKRSFPNERFVWPGLAAFWAFLLIVPNILEARTNVPLWSMAIVAILGLFASTRFYRTTWEWIERRETERA